MIRNKIIKLMVVIYNDVIFLCDGHNFDLTPFSLYVNIYIYIY